MLILFFGWTLIVYVLEFMIGLQIILRIDITKKLLYKDLIFSGIILIPYLICAFKGGIIGFDEIKMDDDDYEENDDV